MTDYRALCAELHTAVQLYTGQNPAAAETPANELVARLMAALAATAAALAQPEPEGPTDQDLDDLANEMLDWNCEGWRAYARAAIAADRARWGRPTIEPVPVAERLPGPEDCDAKGRCWVGCPEFSDDGDYGPTTFNPSWELAPFAQGDTHWLPHNALPIPTP
jgi:hypothetical protein